MTEAVQILGRTGTQKTPDGVYAPIALTPDGMAHVDGSKYARAKAGRLLVATSATGGIALIVAGTAGGHPTLFNPLGSGRVLNVLRLSLAYVSGNNAPGSFAWNFTADAGAAAATGAAIKTATKVAVLSARAGGDVDSKAIWAPTVNTFTSAPVFWRPTGLSLFTGVASTAVAPFKMTEDYDGDLQVAPGTSISLVTVQATTTALFRVMVLFEEIDE